MLRNNIQILKMVALKRVKITLPVLDYIILVKTVLIRF
jgi:hypothetical protein